MGLRIQHNIAAMNAHRNLSISDAGLAKSLERLSSGYRINKAADDAAGLAISEGFRANIASFKVASRNTSEASSMLQVAEGAMDQMNNMLVRLKELATQAASGNVGDTERTKINSEASKLILEIDRLADSTKYGSTYLLNGSFGGKTATRSDAGETKVDGDYSIYKYTDAGADSNTVTITAATSPNMAEGTWTLATGVGNLVELSSGSITATATLTSDVLAFTELGLTLTYAASVTTAEIVADTVVVDATGLSSTAWAVDSDATATTYTLYDTGTGISLYDGTNSQSFTGLSDGAQTLDFSTLGVTLTLGSSYDVGEQNLNSMTLSVGASSTKTFQVGADNDTDNRLSVVISDTTTGASGLVISGLSLASAALAQEALTTIDTAISTLTSRRGDVGAYMNRLSYAAANLATTIENTQAAESVIRDVDMASEMTEFTKNQILLQAGTAMLAQANMAPQSILSLIG